MPTRTCSFTLAIRTALCAAAFVLLVPLHALAAFLLPGFTETTIATGLRQPTAMALAPDGRVFVCEQAGTLRVISSTGALLPDPFVTVTTTSAGERGLLGVAFDPDFATNRFVYVYYTATTPNLHNRVSRFTANGDVAAPGEFVVVDLDPLSAATNHNGGAIHFGPDGKLFIAVGENANRNNAQTLANRLGKILRINKDGTIPEDNPFFNVATGANRAIWAIGLRNPFTFAFRPQANSTSSMFINDVGENTWEEINQGIAGANYGWPETEGVTTDARFVSPVYAYDHSNGCAIAGAAFYEPALRTFPAQYNGSYFFADLCGGWIRSRAAATGSVETFATGIISPVDLHVSDAGSLYYLARGIGAAGGVVVRVDPQRAPSVTMTANGIHGSVLLTQQDSLTIELSFDAGSTGVMNPGEVYIGLLTPFGALWVDTASQQFSPVPRPVVSGAIPSFGPLPLFQFPSLAAVQPGTYFWIVIVDNDTNGAPNGSLFDASGTVIQ